jgi:DNA polymerase (family 10)
MAQLQAADIARLLRELGQRAALRGGNPYRARAYHTAAENLATLSEPLDRLIARGELTLIPRIGNAIADIIAKLHKTGSHPALESLAKGNP